MSRIALVCDWLTTPGGAEKVLLELHRMYPDAPIFTSQYNPKKLDWFQDAHVITGWLRFFPSGLRKFLGPLRQLYFSHLDLTAYDLVISVTGAEAKSVKAKRHICYCHVPTQYYWHMYERYLEQPGFGIINPLVRLGLKLLVKPLRQADYAAAKRPSQFATISHYSAEEIQKYYNRDAEIVFPPVEISKFSTDFSTGKAKKSTTSSKKSANSRQKAPFVISCRQVAWKRIDLAIQACLELKAPLLVIGDGPEHQRLVKLAQGSPLIQFIPWVNSDELATYLASAKAYIFPSLEPFGIAAVEALAAGCPVIAYAEGGSRDIVKPGKNGLLFPEQTVDSLVSALRSFHPQDFQTSAVVASAEPFAPKHFQFKIRRLVRRELGN